MSAGVRDRAWLAAHLPHRGPMNLLDSVANWDAGSIDCVATGHREPGHPLRCAGELPVVAGIEYAAQAAAAHGALVAGEGAPPAAGYLASARSVIFHVRRLDDIDGPLAIHAERIGGDAGGVLYAFRVEDKGRPLVEGRVAVVLGAGRLPDSGPAP